MKIVIALVLGLAVYVALGAVFPPSGAAAIVLPILQAWGVFTYKGVAALMAVGFVHSRL